MKILNRSWRLGFLNYGTKGIYLMSYLNFKVFILLLCWWSNFNIFSHVFFSTLIVKIQNFVLCIAWIQVWLKHTFSGLVFILEVRTIWSMGCLHVIWNPISWNVLMDYELVLNLLFLIGVLRFVVWYKLRFLREFSVYFILIQLILNVIDILIRILNLLLVFFKLKTRQVPKILFIWLLRT